MARPHEPRRLTLPSINLNYYHMLSSPLSTLFAVGIAIGVIFALIGIVILVLLRRVVPTNMVHIVQSTKLTTSYGKGKSAGNTYYAWPSWVPKIGVNVLTFPESIFQVSLSDYEAYDSVRLPFMVDVSAFFRVDQSETAAQRVSSFDELRAQLDSVLKGAVRRILATNRLEEIMEARASLGQQFTAEVDAQIKEWGVITVKTIEFMDLRDSRNSGSKVIANIMAKEQSRIDRESRVAVAENTQKAELAEIDAGRTIEVRRQDAAQQVGLRTAEKDKTVGIAQEQANQEVQTQAAITTQKRMAVTRVEEEAAADIAKNVAITTAEADAQRTIVAAGAALTATQRAAEGTLATGQARAKAEEALLLAPVTAQITLAKEIGDNEGYQTYLITLEQINAGQKVGEAMAGALEKADIKIVGGSPVQGVTGVADMFSTAGGMNLTGMLTALSQTEEGASLLSAATKRLGTSQSSKTTKKD